MSPAAKRHLALVACGLAAILAFSFTYGRFFSYRLYMAWLASGVRGERARFTPGLAEALDPHYEHDLRTASVAYTTRLPRNLAVADCTAMYFGDEALVEHVRQGAALTTRELRWLAHETTHGEQCGRWGGRLAFAETWFEEAGRSAIAAIGRGELVAGFREWLRTRNVRSVHDPMPMELEADARARQVLKALGR